MIGFILYCNSCGNVIKSRVKLVKCPKCGGELSLEKKSVKENVFKQDSKKISNENIKPKKVVLNKNKKSRKRKK